MTAKIDVATLVAQMNEALASIHSTIEGLSTSAAESDTRLDELEQKRDMTIAELKAAYEKEQQELAAARQKELEEIAEQRRREDEEREARRRREDEERAALKAKEDEEKQGTFNTTTRNVEDEMDDLMDSIEEETAKKIAQGEARLAELEEKRRELNRLIEEQMKAAVPPVPTRKRARTVRNSGGAVASAEPSPLPPAETPAQSTTRDKSVAEEAPKPSETSMAGEGSAAKEDDTSQPSDEAQANAPAKEDKVQKGDDSRPQPEEPVAERSVEEGISIKEPQPSEVTPPAEAVVASEASEAVEDKASPEEPAAGAVTSADASKPGPEPEAESARDLKESIVEEPVKSSAANTAGDSHQDAAAETETPSIKAQSAPVEEEDETEKPKGTPENALDEEPSAAEEPSTEEPAAQEPAPAETKIAEAAEAHASAEEHANAPETATNIQKQEEDSKNPDDEPAERQPASQSEDAAPESSLTEEQDDTSESKEEQATSEDVDETTRERSMPEFSMKAVVDEHVSEEDHTAGNAEPLVKEAQPETGDVKERHEVGSNEARDVSEATSKAVGEEPSQEDDAAVDEPSDVGEVAFGEETKHKENTAASEAAVAEPEELAGALTEKSDAMPKETPKESETTATLQDTTKMESSKEPESPTVDTVAVHEDATQDDTAAPIVQTPKSVPAHVEDPSADEPIIEEDSPEQENDRVVDDSPAEDKASIVEEDKHEESTAAEDAAKEDEPAGEPAIVTKETSTKEAASNEREKPADDEFLSEVRDSSDEAEPADAKDTAVEPSYSMASLTQDRSENHTESFAQLSDDQFGETAEKESLGEETAQDAAKDEDPKNNAAIEENLSGGQLAEEQFAKEPATHASQSQEDGQLQDDEDVHLDHAKEASMEESSATGNEVQTQPDSQETPVEVSELPPRTQEEEEHLPTAASKDLEDGDSKHGDTPHTPEEQLARSVSDAAKDDSATGPSDATANAPADVELTEDVEADGKAHTSESKSQAEDQKLQGDKDVREEASADSDEEDHDDQIDHSDSLETRVEVEKAQFSGSEQHEHSPEFREVPMPSSHATKTEQTEKEKVVQATAEGSDHHEIQSSLADDDLHDDDLKEATDGDEGVTKPIFAHEEMVKAVADDEDQAQKADMPAKEDETHDESHVNDSHQHDSQSAATVTRGFPGSIVGFETESTQHDSHRADVQVLDPFRGDVSFDDADRSREPDLSVITEDTEPAASTVGDTSASAAKSQEYFHPESVSRNVSAAPDATLNSSYMTETTSMVADQSYEQEQQHGSFSPTVGALERNDNGLVSSGTAYLDEEEDDSSSSVQSVKEDDGINDPSEASYNPFARGNAASYEQPAYQSSDIPYNPFALQTVVEEEPPLNPFAKKTEDDAPEAPYNSFARNTTSAADNFLRSASALGHSQPSSPEQSFPRSASAQGRRGSVSSNNPFARSVTPSDQSVFPTAAPLGQQDVARSPNNPFARPPSAKGHYESEDTDTDDEEALAAAESTYRNLFPVRYSSPMANEDMASAAQDIERRQPTPPVPESVYSNPFAPKSSPVGVDVAESRFHQGFSSPADEDDYSFAGADGSVNPGAQQFVQDSSPLSARHLAPVSLDSIQERYNSELEDMDSDSEEPESLTTSQQLPASQNRAIPPMPSIAERSLQDFEDSDEEEDWGSRGPQNSRMDNLVASPEYRPSPPPPPPRSPNSHNLHSEEAEDSSEDDGDIFSASPARPVQTNLLSSSQYGATPPPPSPPPRVLSSQGHYSQQQEQEDSSEGEQNEWDDAFTPVQPSTLPFQQSEATQPPRAPSSLSQKQLRVEDSDEEDQVVLPASIAQPNIPNALSLSENHATPPPPSPPRAPSSQGLYNQEHQDSSEDEAPRSQDIARPGQFPFSSSSQSRATPPPPPPPRAPSSHGQYRQDLEDSDDEEDERDSKATLPGQIPSLSASQYGATPPPPPPPRVTSAQGRYRQDLEDSDSEENEEAWEANQYGQTTNLMGASSLMGSNQMAQASMEDPALSGPGPAASSSSSRDLQSHQRKEDGEESDDSWENIGQRGETHAVNPADRTSPALPTPQLRVDGYEHEWSNASNDRISTTSSTYLQRSGPGDFTDIESQEYATPLPSAEFSASSQYTQGAMDSPRHPESAGLKNTYDQSHNRGIASPSYGQHVSIGHESSLADELARGDGDLDSDSDVSEYDHTQAPAFLTQGFTSQPQQHSDEPITEQVITAFHSDEDDGPKTAVISDEDPVQYASARFGATSWRDELRSPVLFGATRHSRSGSLKEEIQKSLHQEADSSRPSSPESAYQPELHAENPYMQQQSQIHDQQVLDQQPQLFGQELHAPQSAQQHPYGQTPLETQPFGLAGGSLEQPQAPSVQPTASPPELRVQISDVQAEEDDEQRTPHLAPQTSEQHTDISPLALRQESPATSSLHGSPSRGLAFSRHNPDRPQTPPTQTATEEGVDPELIVPRDVTNVPWHARADSVPYSVQSQSTIDSVASSPVHSALHADKHEPVIRDSWPASMHNLTRPRNDSTLTDRDDYDPFKYEGGVKPMRGPSGSVGSRSDSPPRNSVSNSSPGSLISRMRGIFENSQAKQEPASPARSRSASGVFRPVQQRTKSGSGDESPGYERKAGFLNEVDDEIDEQSALLRSSAGGLDAN